MCRWHIITARMIRETVTFRLGVVAAEEVAPVARIACSSLVTIHPLAVLAGGAAAIRTKQAVVRGQFNPMNLLRFRHLKMAAK